MCSINMNIEFKYTYIIKMTELNENPHYSYPKQIIQETLRALMWNISFIQSVVFSEIILFFHVFVFCSRCQESNSESYGKIYYVLCHVSHMRSPQPVPRVPFLNWWIRGLSKHGISWLGWASFLRHHVWSISSLILFSVYLSFQEIFWSWCQTVLSLPSSLALSTGLVNNKLRGCWGRSTCLIDIPPPGKHSSQS